MTNLENSRAGCGACLRFRLRSGAALQAHPDRRSAASGMTNLENSRAGCGGALAVPAQVGGSSASAPGSPLRGVRNDEFGEFASRLRGALAIPAQVGGSSASALGSPLRGVRNDESICRRPVRNAESPLSYQLQNCRHSGRDAVAIRNPEASALQKRLKRVRRFNQAARRTDRASTDFASPQARVSTCASIP